MTKIKTLIVDDEPLARKGLAVRLEEYSDIDGYLDNKMVHNAQITNQIRSVLNSLDDHINSQHRVISESQNTSGGDKNET